MARFSMKQHAYFREKLLYGIPGNPYATFIPEFLNGITEGDLNSPTITIEGLRTEFRRYMYYSFAPTLIYRDEYPRIGATVRWAKVHVLAANVACAILALFIVFKTSLTPFFQETYNEPLTLKLFMLSMFKSMAPGVMMYFLLFFGFLHCWMNMWAEMLRFGDRLFYTDWWNAACWASYYRRWNIVVHDWLAHYVYQDIIRFSWGKMPKLGAYFFVFMFSALIHELIISISFKFFMPVLMGLFGGPGVILISLTKSDRPFLNISFWAMMFMGHGIIVVFYSRHFY
jgi:sterol O-acyltransferase